jgi:MFS transporter, MHS family, proline/betaine transporter
MEGRMPTTSELRKNVLAGVIGNVLEWYDFAIYGFLAPILGRRFFPADDQVASLLAAFSVFAIGCAARPLGAAFFGHIGDKVGRKPALMISVIAMGLATFSIGVLPDHAQIGVTATIALVVLRIAQGLSVGGEYTGSIVFVCEHAPLETRGYLASWPQFGCDAGFLLGSGLGAMTSTMLGEAAMESWGWRLPFILGAVIAVCGIGFRRHITEPTALTDAKRSAAPVIAAFRGHWRPMLRMICLILPGSIGFYTLFVYMSSYVTEHLHFTTAQALDANTVTLLLMLVLTIPCAKLSDRLGRKPMLYVFSAGILVFSLPLWWLMHQESLGSILLGELGFGLLFVSGFAVLPATMIEMLPAEVRYSGVSIGYNICLGIFGGTAPLLAAYLVDRTGNAFAPVYCLMAAAALSFGAVLGLPESARQPLG